MSKENKAGKENLSPTPPIREKGETKESTTTGYSRARALVVDIHHPPTLDTLLAWTTSRRYTDVNWIRNWFDIMANEYYWLDSRTGEPIRHWVALFRKMYLDDHRKDKKSSVSENISPERRERIEFAKRFLK